MLNVADFYLCMHEKNTSFFFLHNYVTVMRKLYQKLKLIITKTERGENNLLTFISDGIKMCLDNFFS